MNKFIKPKNILSNPRKSLFFNEKEFISNDEYDEIIGPIEELIDQSLSMFKDIDFDVPEGTILEREEKFNEMIELSLKKLKLINDYGGKLDEMKNSIKLYVIEYLEDCKKGIHKILDIDYIKNICISTIINDILKVKSVKKNNEDNQSFEFIPSFENIKKIVSHNGNTVVLYNDNTIKVNKKGMYNLDRYAKIFEYTDIDLKKIIDNEIKYDNIIDIEMQNGILKLKADNIYHKFEEIDEFAITSFEFPVLQTDFGEKYLLGTDLESSDYNYKYYYLYYPRNASPVNITFGPSNTKNISEQSGFSIAFKNMNKIVDFSLNFLKGNIEDIGHNDAAYFRHEIRIGPVTALVKYHDAQNRNSVKIPFNNINLAKFGICIGASMRQTRGTRGNINNITYKEIPYTLDKCKTVSLKKQCTSISFRCQNLSNTYDRAVLFIDGIRYIISMTYTNTIEINNLTDDEHHFTWLLFNNVELYDVLYKINEDPYVNVEETEFADEFKIDKFDIEYTPHLSLRSNIKFISIEKRCKSVSFSYMTVGLVVFSKVLLYIDDIFYGQYSNVEYTTETINNLEDKVHNFKWVLFCPIDDNIASIKDIKFDDNIILCEDFFKK